MKKNITSSILLFAVLLLLNSIQTFAQGYYTQGDRLKIVCYKIKR